MTLLNGKVAISMVGGRSIGRATARLFAAEGAKVAIFSRTQAHIDALAADIEAGSVTAIGVHCDVHDANQIKAVMDTRWWNAHRRGALKQSSRINQWRKA